MFSSFSDGCFSKVLIIGISNTKSVFLLTFVLFLLLTFLGGEAGAAIKIRLRLHTKNPVSTGSATLVEITPSNKGMM